MVHAVVETGLFEWSECVEHHPVNEFFHLLPVFVGQASMSIFERCEAADERFLAPPRGAPNAALVRDLVVFQPRVDDLLPIFRHCCCNFDETEKKLK